MEASKYHKPASPKTLFDRFLQRQTQAPTEVQVQKWEDEGGRIDPVEQDMLTPDEHDSTSRKVKLYFARAWRAITANRDSVKNEEEL